MGEGAQGFENTRGNPILDLPVVSCRNMVGTSPGTTRVGRDVSEGAIASCEPGIVNERWFDTMSTEDGRRSGCLKVSRGARK